jgi:hypothetical protein
MPVVYPGSRWGLNIEHSSGRPRNAIGTDPNRKLPPASSRYPDQARIQKTIRSLGGIGPDSGQLPVHVIDASRRRPFWLLTRSSVVQWR